MHEIDRLCSEQLRHPHRMLDDRDTRSVHPLRGSRPMPLHPLAGQPAPAAMSIDVQRLEDAYYTKQPNLDDPTQLVAFGTSGHRGTSLAGTSPRRTSWPSRKPSAIIAARRASPARCMWDRTRMPYRRRHSARPWKCWPPTVLKPSFRARAASRLRPSSRARFWLTIAVAPRAWPTAS